MNEKNRMIAVQVLALIGLFLAIELCVIYYNANYDKYALSSFCSINKVVDCDGVAKTTFSQFLGIPLSYWGVFFYVTVLFLTVVNYLKKIRFLKFLEVFKNPMSYIAALGLVSFICSLVLAGISIFYIKKICILCFITYFIDLLIVAVTVEKSLLDIFKTTISDFIEGVKKYTKTFIVLCLLFFGFIAYSGVTLNFVPNVKQIKSINKYRKMKFNPYRVKGNELGNPEGDVVVELYSDYVCPLCYINNIMIHKAVKEYKNISVNHHNYPFDKECNKYMVVNIHPHACFMSRAAVAAGNQGNYWEMSSLMYEKQPVKMEDMLKLSEQLGFDNDKFKRDIDSKETLDKIKKEIEIGQLLEIDSTPTMIINGEKVVGVKPYYKLQEILESHGAKRK